MASESLINFRALVQRGQEIQLETLGSVESKQLVRFVCTEYCQRTIILSLFIGRPYVEQETSKKDEEETRTKKEMTFRWTLIERLLYWKLYQF